MTTQTQPFRIVENTTDIPLLPCPFSGRPAQIIAFTDEEIGDTFSVSAAGIKNSDEADAFSAASSLEEAITDWNQRCDAPSNDKLKPCPFCGAPAKHTKKTQEEVDEWGCHKHVVFCSKDCHANPCARADTRDEAVKAWNTRAA